jgi:hypothetical protein
MQCGDVKMALKFPMRIQQRWEDLGDGGHDPTVTDLQPRALGGPFEDDDLLAEQRVLGNELGTRAEEVADHTEVGLDELAKHSRGP